VRNAHRLTRQGKIKKMFSSAIQGMINSGGADAAKKRVSQIETLIMERAKMASAAGSTRSQNSQTLTEIPSFDDVLNEKPVEPLKFKLAEPLKTTKAEIMHIVDAVTERLGVNKKLVMSVINQESGFNPNAVSSAGAKGLMQLMPQTAKNLGVLNPFSPQQNIEGGVRYLKQMLDKYNGNVILALAAYNAGSANVDKYGGVPPFKETQNYVKSILSQYLG
jgi:soluble lytic murein transglycosylase-like protein